MFSLLLKWKLSSLDADKRIAAIKELAASGRPRATELIAEALVRAIDLARSVSKRPSGSKGDSVKDIIDNANVQRTAADALGQLKDSRAVDPLVRALTDGSEEYVRVAAAKALGRIGDKRAVGPLVAMITKWKYSWALLASVAGALGEIGDPDTVGPLQEMLETTQVRYKDLLSRREYAYDPGSQQMRDCEEDLKKMTAILENTTLSLHKLGKASPVRGISHSQASNPPATGSMGAATMRKVCEEHRSRLKPIQGDPLFNQTVQQLKSEGAAGAQALAALIDELLRQRCGEIVDALMVASRLSSEPQLVTALQRVLAAPAVIAGQADGNKFRPVIVGGGKIGWDGSTAELIKRRASEALDSITGTKEIRLLTD